jgi:hypothetical protein
MLPNVMAFWSISLPVEIFYGHLVIFCGHFGIFFPFWYFVPKDLAAVPQTT